LLFSGFGNQLLSKVALSGVGDTYKKYSADSEFKGVKAHFRMDESGLLHLDMVDSVFEKQPPSSDEKEEESTLSSKLSSLSLMNYYRAGRPVGCTENADQT
jgi:hypoxia up-regulated 1